MASFLHQSWSKASSCFKQRKSLVIGLLTITVLALVVVLTPQTVNAQLGDVFTPLRWIRDALLVIFNLLGKLLVSLIQMMIGVAQYNDFINSVAVTKGWIIVRDVVNILFVIVMIITAFATIVGAGGSWELKSRLPSIFFAAVLVNFSKTLFGLVIDFGQVLMLTFINAFKGAAAGNLTSAFGLQDMLRFRDIPANELTSTTITDGDIIALLLLSIVALVIASLIVGALVVFFIERIVVLWVVVVLAPLAFVSKAVPPLTGVGQKIFSSLFSYVFKGIGVAFFLWLAFAVMQAGNINKGFTAASTGEQGLQGQIAGGSPVVVALSAFGSADKLLSFIIAIALLIMALGMAKQVGRFTGQVVEKLQATGLKGLKLAGGMAATVTGAKALYQAGKARVELVKSTFAEQRKKAEERRKGAAERGMVGMGARKYQELAAGARVGAGEALAKVAPEAGGRRALEARAERTEVLKKGADIELEQQKKLIGGLVGDEKDRYVKVALGGQYGDKATLAAGMTIMEKNPNDNRVAGYQADLNSLAERYKDDPTMPGKINNETAKINSLVGLEQERYLNDSLAGKNSDEAKLAAGEYLNAKDPKDKRLVGMKQELVNIAELSTNLVTRNSVKDVVEKTDPELYTKEVKKIFGKLNSGALEFVKLSKQSLKFLAENGMFEPGAGLDDEQLATAMRMIAQRGVMLSDTALDKLAEVVAKESVPILKVPAALLEKTAALILKKSPTTTVKKYVNEHVRPSVLREVHQKNYVAGLAAGDLDTLVEAIRGVAVAGSKINFVDLKNPVEAKTVVDAVVDNKIFVKQLVDFIEPKQPPSAELQALVGDLANRLKGNDGKITAMLRNLQENMKKAVKDGDIDKQGTLTTLVGLLNNFSDISKILRDKKYDELRDNAGIP